MIVNCGHARRAAPSRASAAPSLAEVMRGRRRRHRLHAGVICAGIALLIAGDHFGLGLVPSQDARRHDGRTFAVERVIAGDTLLLRPAGANADADANARDDAEGAAGNAPSFAVRLFAVDLPADASLADAARRRLVELTADPRVTLHLHRRFPRDARGNLVAFVELADGGIANERLILEGLARADATRPHRHLDRYQTLEHHARQRRRGLWKTAAE